MFKLLFQHGRFWLWLFGVAMLGVLLVSCASSKKRDEVSSTPLVWPPAPAEPRVRFVQSIVGPASIGQTENILRRFSSFLIGDAGERHNLVKPCGVALDEAGNLCVTDTGAGAVYYFDFAKKKWQRWFSAGKTRFSAPV